MKMKLIVLSAFALTMISSGAAAIAQQAAPQSSQPPTSQAAPRLRLPHEQHCSAGKDSISASQS